jgi:hypothetical protein
MAASVVATHLGWPSSLVKVRPVPYPFGAAVAPGGALPAQTPLVRPFSQPATFPASPDIQLVVCLFSRPRSVRWR